MVKLRLPNSHLLCYLVLVECNSTATALHDDCRVEAAEDACLVVFSRVELCSDGIIWVCELSIAGRAHANAI